MPNENETKEKQVKAPEEPKTASPDIQDFIKEVKENGVSKAEYEKVLAERDKAIQDRNQVMRSVLDGETLNTTPKSEKTIEEYRAEYSKILKKRDATNLEVVTAQMNLRDAILASGGQDPCVAPNGTEADYASAAKVAQAKKECILEANGDPKKFLYLWEQRIAQDDPTLVAALKKRSLKNRK